MPEITIDFLKRRYAVIDVFEVSMMDLATKAIFEMYAKNVCQQLEWNNGEAATDVASDGAKKLLVLDTRSGVIGAVVLFAICIKTQLDWNNGRYATDVAKRGASLVLEHNVEDGLPLVQKLFDICVNQQLKWGNGGYSREITDTFSQILAKYCK